MYLHFAVFIQLCLLSRAQLRSPMYRVFVSLPASFFFSTVLFSIPLFPLLSSQSGPSFYLFASIPISLAFIGLIQSLETKKSIHDWEKIDIDFTEDRDVTSTVKRVSEGIPKSNSKTLRIVQLTGTTIRTTHLNEETTTTLSNWLSSSLDPHLGPLMPVSRLRKICEDIVKIDPDVVLLTGTDLEEPPFVL